MSAAWLLQVLFLIKINIYQQIWQYFISTKNIIISISLHTLSGMNVNFRYTIISILRNRLFLDLNFRLVNSDQWSR